MQHAYECVFMEIDGDPEHIAWCTLVEDDHWGSVYRVINGNHLVYEQPDGTFAHEPDSQSRRRGRIVDAMAPCHGDYNRVISQFMESCARQIALDPKLQKKFKRRKRT